MYGGDEPSTPSPPVRSQVQQQQQQQQQREVYVGEDLPPRSNSTRRKKSKEPSPSATIPTIVTPKSQNNSSPLRSAENSRSFSVTGDDIEAAFDAINDYKATINESSNNKIKEQEISSPDSLFGLSTIKEAIDSDEIVLGAGSSKQQQKDDAIDEIDFDNCFTKYKQEQQPQTQTKPVEEKKKKSTAPTTPVIPQTQKNQEPKSSRHSKEQKYTPPFHTDDVQTPSFSIPTPRIDPTPSPSVTLSSTKQMDSISNHLDDSNGSIDEDVDELLGKLEVSIDPSSIYAHIHTHTYTRIRLFKF